MPRKPPSLESFSPELKQAWVKASTGVVVLELPSQQTATSLRHRLYKLRTALKAASDPLYLSAQHATIRVEPRGDGLWALIMEPADSIYKDAFAKAGIGVEPPALDFDLPETD